MVTNGMVEVTMVTMVEVTTINLIKMGGGVQVRHRVQPIFSVEGVSIERCSDSL